MTNNNPNQSEPRGRFGALTTPLSLRGVPVWLIYALGLLSVVYVLNPGSGIFELLPDNIPLVGNLDEGAAFTMLWYALVELIERRKIRR